MQITERIHAFRISFQLPIAPEKTLDRFAYAYLLCGHNLVLIDSGVAGWSSSLLEYLGKTGRQPEELDWLLLTHAHPDHIGGVLGVQRATGCRIAAHTNDALWIEDVERQFLERPVPGFHSIVEGSVKVDRCLTEGESFMVGDDLTLTVVFAPGHSPGQVAFWEETEGALFSGDSVPLPGDLPIYDDVVASARTIRRLQGIQDVKVLFSSWEAPLAGDEIPSRLEAGLNYLQSIHEATLNAAGNDSNPDITQIASQVVRKIGLPPFAMNPLFFRSIQAHLNARHLPDLRENGASDE